MAGHTTGWLFDSCNQLVIQLIIVFYSPITFRYLIFLTLPTLGFSQYFLSYAILRNFSSDIMRSISTLFMICIIFSNAIFLQSLSGIAIWFTLFRKFQIFQCLIHFPPSLAIVDFSIKIFFFTILHFNLPMLQLFQLNLFYIHDLYIWYQCALSFLTTLQYLFFIFGSSFFYFPP